MRTDRAYPISSMPPCAARRLRLAATFRYTALAGLAVVAVSARASAPDGGSVTASRAASRVPLSGKAGCLPDGTGYLRARIQGAVRLQIDWHNAELECAGSARPGGRGLRLSFSGPLPRSGRRLSMIFGVGGVSEGRAGRELPTNVTVIFQGERRLYSTLSENKCTVDRLRQVRIAHRDGIVVYRVVARGFCFDPLTDLIRDDRIVMSRFDFAGRIAFASPTH